MSPAARRRFGGFSLIEVIAVLVVVGLVTAMASASLSGVTRAQRVEDAVERLRVLDARVRVLAEREHRPWRLRLDDRGAAASPAEEADPEEETLRVRLDPTLRLRPWVAGRGDGEEVGDTRKPVELWVHATGGSVDYGWAVERVKSDGLAGTEPGGSVGAFAGGTGRFTALSREAVAAASGSSR